MLKLKTLLCATVFALEVCSAHAADIQIEGPAFAPWHPVPHVHLSGPVQTGDTARLAETLNEACARYECSKFENTRAVLSLASPGGNFLEGIKLAALIRDSQIATIVLSGDRCYSACTMAWLGGSGFHQTGGVGTYIDRYIEPGAALGFHAPYIGDDALRQLSPADRLQVQIDGLRLGIAEMVRFLVEYGVSPKLVDRLILMGPDEMYDATTIADLVRLKAELPPGSLAELGLRPRDMVFNACLNILALHYQADFGSDLPLIPNFGKDTMALADGRVLQGYPVDDRPLNVSFCGTPELIGRDADAFSIHLARMAWKDGMNDTYADPRVTLNYSRSSWNSAGYQGGRATESHLRLTPMLSWLLPPDMRIVDVPLLELSPEIPKPAIAPTYVPNLFDTLKSPSLPTTGTGPRRDYVIGVVDVFAIVGGPELLQDAKRVRSSIPGANITYEMQFANAYVFSGFANSSRTLGFYRFVLQNGERSVLFDLSFPMTSDEKPFADAGKTVTRVACSTTFGGVGLPCAKQ